MKNTENMIEWLNGQKTLTLSICDTAMKNRILKLSKTDSNVTIVAINKDAILAKIPIEYLKISAPKKIKFNDMEERANRLH